MRGSKRRSGIAITDLPASLNNCVTNGMRFLIANVSTAITRAHTPKVIEVRTAASCSPLYSIPEGNCDATELRNQRLLYLAILILYIVRHTQNMQRGQ